jgi:hypothetical protein
VEVSVYLVLLRREFSISRLLREGLGLSRYRRQTLVASILDDRCDETIVRSNGNRNVRLVMPVGL